MKWTYWGPLAAVVMDMDVEKRYTAIQVFTICQFILVSVGEDSERLMVVVGGRGVWDMWQRSVSSQHSWNHMCEPMEVVKTVLSKIWKHKETKTCTYYFKDCVMDMEVYKKSLLIWAFILMYRFSWVVFPLCVFSIFLLLVMLGN